MATIPRAVLSEHFQQRISGGDRRLLAAVFLTYRFDPGFFEQEVLPVFLDVPVSHATRLRLVQLEDALRVVRHGAAVYYDPSALVSGGEISAKLDVRRIPIRPRTGVFHPKNVLLLLEAPSADEDEPPRRSLLVASLSANLTRPGWWENVEACHVEVIEDGDVTRIRDDLLAFLSRVRRAALPDADHAAMEAILDFLRASGSRVKRSTDGRIHPHFYGGGQSIADFLQDVTGRDLSGANLEIISPYLDDAESSRPILELVERFRPKEVRIFLPRSPAGEGLVREDLYDSLSAEPSVQWGRLPKEVLRMGRGEDVAERRVHAKVYRFFTQKPKREVCFVGSPNLTWAAHQAGGNVESGFVVEVPVPRAPDWWLEPDRRRPPAFEPLREDEDTDTSGGLRLALRYDWSRALASAHWDAPEPSESILLASRGVEIGAIGSLRPREWIELAGEVARRLEDALGETSFVEARVGPVRGFVLVQEEGMAHKPSLLLDLSAGEILKYWALLTPAQRAAFLEARAPEALLSGEGAELVTRHRLVPDRDALFDRFAGFFHGFASLERSVRAALDDGNEREAVYRLFGKKYDSLGNLLDRVLRGDGAGDDVDRYLLLSCASQLLSEVARDYPDFWREQSDEARAIEARLESSEATAIRGAIIARDAESMPGFLDWFDRWFQRRAAPVEAEP